MPESLDYIVDIMQLERYLKKLTTNWATTTGLTLNDLRILIYVQREPGSEITKVATGLHVAKVSLIQNIGTLTKAGLLTSEPSAKDRRVHVLTLTSQGHKRMQAIDEQLTASLSQSSAKKLVDNLAKLYGDTRDIKAD